MQIPGAKAQEQRKGQLLKPQRLNQKLLVFRDKLVQRFARHTGRPNDVVDVMLPVQQRQQMLRAALRNI